MNDDQTLHATLRVKLRDAESGNPFRSVAAEIVRSTLPQLEAELGQGVMITAGAVTRVLGISYDALRMMLLGHWGADELQRAARVVNRKVEIRLAPVEEWTDS